MNNNIIKYYENSFHQDLNLLLHLTGNKLDRISIVSLMETMNAPGFYGLVQKSFKKIPHKSFFLISYFYSVLLDQAIHSYDKDLHQDFDKIANYPKFVGILSSCSENFNPLFLLLISSKYVKNHDSIINDFKDFTKYIFKDYIDFFYNIFPKYTLHLNQKQINIYTLLNKEQYIALVLKNIFIDIKNSINRESAPIQIWEKIQQKNIKLYYTYIDIIQEEVKKIIIEKKYNKSLERNI